MCECQYGSWSVVCDCFTDLLFLFGVLSQPHFGEGGAYGKLAHGLPCFGEKVSVGEGLHVIQNKRGSNDIMARIMKTDSMQIATGLASRVVCTAKMGVIDHALRLLLFFSSGFIVMCYHCAKAPKSPKYPSVVQKWLCFMHSPSHECEC